VARLCLETAIGQLTVCAVTVTYGDRWHLLRRVLERLCAWPAVARVIIVDNGATYDLRGRTAGAFGLRVEVVGSGRNEGSARGYAIGMKAAREAVDTEFVWLLDDDNFPESGALEALAEAWRELSAGQASDRLALLALRTDRPYLVQIAAGADPRRIFPKANSFLDFHAADAPRRVWRKLFRRRPALTTVKSRSVKIPYGVYGGLLFHKTLLDRVGYPDESYFLYGDDYDFTTRISDGGAVYLVAGSRIDDLDPSWHVSSTARRVTVFQNLSQAPDFRVYCTVRSNVIFVRRHLLTRPWVWQLNRLAYLAILRAFMWATGRRDRYDLIARAVSDGCSGRLEKVGCHVW